MPIDKCNNVNIRVGAWLFKMLLTIFILIIINKYIYYYRLNNISYKYFITLLNNI